MYGVSGSWEHVATRMERVPRCHWNAVKAVMSGLVRRTKARTMPNTTWYKPVYADKHIVGYVLGQGNYISTILASDMVPHGKQL